MNSWFKFGGLAACRMINPEETEDRQNEPAEVRELSKAQLYSRVSQAYCIPDRACRATSRAYLVSVFTGTVFRVDRFNLLQFEARLQLDELVKNGSYNVTILIERLSLLLTQLGNLPLGFKVGAFPDEAWLMRVVRFVDPSNILGVFTKAVRNSTPPAIPATRV